MTKTHANASAAPLNHSRLLALEDAAQAFAAAHAGGHSNVWALQRAIAAYEAAFEAALSVHPDREIILCYAKSATSYAQHNKDCDAATVGGLNASVIGRTRALFMDWQVREKAFVEAGYRAISYQSLYDSARWPGASKKLPFLLYEAFFARRKKGESVVLHTDQMLSRNPALANPHDLLAGEEVVAWDGSRMVLGRYQRTRGGEHLVSVGVRSISTNFLLRSKVGCETGLWPYAVGLRIAAYLDGVWVEAVWSGFDGDTHIVRQVSGQLRTSQRVHSYQDAVNMNLLQPLAA
jgi:hypothetical protein